MADMSVVALGAVVGYVVVSYIQKTKAQSDADKIAALLLGNPEVAAWLEQNWTETMWPTSKPSACNSGWGCSKPKPCWINIGRDESSLHTRQRRKQTADTDS